MKLMIVNGITLPEGCEIGVFTPTEDETTHTITHSLGEVPKYAVCLYVADKDYDNVGANTIVFEELMSNPETGTFDYGAGTAYCRNTVVSYNDSSHSMLTTNTYTTYPADMTATTVTFATGRYYNGRFKANENYVYILTK